MSRTILTKKQLAEFLKVSQITIDRYEAKGMPVLRPPEGSPRYCQEDVLEWMKPKRCKNESNK